MFSRISIQLKFLMVFSFAVILIFAGLLIGVQGLKTKQLHNEAVAVADQVIAFRSWVANTGVVWTNRLTGDFHDYLSKKPDGAGNFFFSKNPALATRELSTFVSKTSTRATFRVTSDNYRNIENKPDEFEANSIKRFKQNGKLKSFGAYEDDLYRYSQPLYVKKACLRCHGDPVDAPKDVIEKYGDKQAFGYEVGDVRGIISVKLPDIKLIEITMSLLNLYTIGLIVAAFLITFLFTQYTLINRLKKLAANTEEIAKGNFDLQLSLDEKSKDEIVQVTGAVDMLRRSMAVAMKHMQQDE